MSEILPEDAAQPNGEAHDFGPVPVMGTEPVKPKAKRKRKKKAAPKVARAPKVKPIDPLIAEQLSSSLDGTAAAVEEAPTPTLLTGVGADHLVERRERIHARQFDAAAPARAAPPIKSTWRQRFVFGLRRMTGLDGTDDPEPFTLSSTLKAFLIAAVCVSGAGVYMAWF